MARSHPDLFEPARTKARVPYDFVLDELASMPVSTRAMFGSTAVYVGELVVFILRHKGDADDGVWLAYEGDRELAVHEALPTLQRIKALPNVRYWRMLAANSPSFEDDVLKACALVREGDLLGRLPARKKAKAPRRASERTPAKRKTAKRAPAKRKASTRR